MKKELILVVEDESIMREALVDYFSDAGHQVDTASDGDKALEKYDLKNYGIMIIDLKLPGRDGLSVLNEVRTINPKTRVIIITAFPSKETEMEAKKGGAIDYLTKPFELHYLEELMKQSYEVDTITEPVVDEPIGEEEIIAPCIWMQAGVITKRACTIGYQCHRGCKFHAAMMKNEKFRDDPRIKPLIDKLNVLLGDRQCRYTMSGVLSARSCPQLYHCESCEFDQMIQDEISRQSDLKKELRIRKRAVKKEEPIQ